MAQSPPYGYSQNVHSCNRRVAYGRLLFVWKYAILLLQTFSRISWENANFLKATLHNLSAVLPQETGFYFVSKEQAAVGKAPAGIYGSPGAAHCGGGGHCVLWTVQCPPAERHYGRRRAGRGAAAAPLVWLARFRHHAGAGYQLLSFGPEGFGAGLYQVVRGLHFVRLRLFPAVGDLAALPAGPFRAAAAGGGAGGAVCGGGRWAHRAPGGAPPAGTMPWPCPSPRR